MVEFPSRERRKPLMRHRPPFAHKFVQPVRFGSLSRERIRKSLIPKGLIRNPRSQERTQKLLLPQLDAPNVPCLTPLGLLVPLIVFPSPLAAYFLSLPCSWVESLGVGAHPLQPEFFFLTSAVDFFVKPSLTGIILEELADFLKKRGVASYRAKQITYWIYKKRVASFDAMTDLPNELRTRLAAEFDSPKMDVVRILGSKDTTQKFLFRLRDQNLIESVLIPASPALYGQPSDRRTICVSSQVGCAYGCKFCASGLEGFSRNLDAAEMVQQLIEIEKQTGEKIDNVVFMGMGEPLANLKNLLRAIRIINAPWGLGIGARHITVSTSGLAPQIRELANESTQLRLALSLHGATDEVRGKIMPVNRKYPLKVLLEACDYYVAKKRKITFEYILIAGVNDNDEQVRELAKIARRLSAKINLIPYNTVEGLKWSRPSRERQEQFQSILRKHGVVATLRREKGSDIAAACGQLRLQRSNREERHRR
jgi:23S rRNA (adenine2503-C2)-methyltransferase